MHIPCYSWSIISPIAVSFRREKIVQMTTEPSKSISKFDQKIEKNEQKKHQKTAKIIKKVNMKNWFLSIIPHLCKKNSKKSQNPKIVKKTSKILKKRDTFLNRHIRYRDLKFMVDFSKKSVKTVKIIKKTSKKHKKFQKNSKLYKNYKILMRIAHLWKIDCKNMKKTQKQQKSAK